jgi:hypothetical protein
VFRLSFLACSHPYRLVSLSNPTNGTLPHCEKKVPRTIQLPRPTNAWRCLCDDKKLFNLKTKTKRRTFDTNTHTEIVLSLFVVRRSYVGEKQIAEFVLAAVRAKVYFSTSLNVLASRCGNGMKLDDGRMVRSYCSSQEFLE